MGTKIDTYLYLYNYDHGYFWGNYGHLYFPFCLYDIIMHTTGKLIHLTSIWVDIKPDCACVEKYI